MSDERTGRELTPRGEDQGLEPREAGRTSTERFYAGDRAHTVLLTEERAAQVVRQSGNARNIAFLATLLIVLFIPLYWFWDIGFAPFGVEARQKQEADAQYVTDVSRGYALFLANCARCHSTDGKSGDGKGGIGPPLNDQAKLYNVLTSDGGPGKGHLNPNYLHAVLREGGRYVCGDANSLMPAWQIPNGPLNYREIEELIAFITASSDRQFQYQPGHPEGGGTAPPPVTVTPWRDPSFSPAPGATPVPACWRNPSGQIGGAAPGAGASAAPITSPGTPDAPRVIKLDETPTLQITAEGGAPVPAIPVKKGETVRFEVTNTAGFPHNFYVGPKGALEANDRATAKGIPDFPSGTQTFDYTFTDGAPDLQFACIVPGHYPTMHGDFQITP